MLRLLNHSRGGRRGWGLKVGERIVSEKKKNPLIKQPSQADELYKAPN